MPVTKAKILGPRDGKAGLLIAIGVRFMVSGDDSGGGFSLVEHPLPPRTLAAPLHRHSREDEYSFVLRGRVGALSDGVTVVGEVGDLIFKPRHAWHTFWNAGDEPASILEIISPAGFERFFEKLVDMPAGGPPDPAVFGAVATEYGLEMDFERVPRLLQEYGLRFEPPN